MADDSLVKTLSQVAGIGGLSLFVFALLFREVIRKDVFPKLNKEHAYRIIRLFMVLVFALGLVGLLSWVYVNRSKDPVPSFTATPLFDRWFCLLGMAGHEPGAGDQKEKRIEPPEEATIVFRKWLGRIDGGEYLQGWNMMAPPYKKQIAPGTFVNLFEKRRKPKGEIKSRTLKENRIYHTLPGAIPGVYQIRTYLTCFKSGESVFETLAAMGTSDGWKIALHLIDVAEEGDWENPGMIQPGEAPATAFQQWLERLDKGSYEDAWESMPSPYKEQYTKQGLVQIFESQRTPRGKVLSRELLENQFQSSMPGAAPGYYAISTYRTHFENGDDLIERLVAMGTKDGWKVASHTLMPAPPPKPLLEKSNSAADPFVSRILPEKPDAVDDPTGTRTIGPKPVEKAPENNAPHTASDGLVTVGIPVQTMPFIMPSAAPPAPSWAASIQMILARYEVHVPQSKIVQRYYGSAPGGNLLNLPVSLPAITASLNNWSLNEVTGQPYVVKCQLGMKAPPATLLLNELTLGYPVLIACHNAQAAPGHMVVITAASYYPTPTGPNIISITVIDPGTGVANLANQGRVTFNAAELANSIIAYWQIRVQR